MVLDLDETLIYSKVNPDNPLDIVASRHRS